MSDRDENWIRLRDAFNRRREDLGLGPTALAARAGLAFQTVNDAITGARRPQERTRREIARGLGWPSDVPERILAGQDPDVVLDSLSLEDVDDVLEENAEEYVRNYEERERQTVSFRRGAGGRDVAGTEVAVRARALAEHANLAEMLEAQVMSRGWRLSTRQELGLSRRVDVAWVDESGNAWVGEVRPGRPSQQHVDEIIGLAADLRVDQPGVLVVLTSLGHWPQEATDRLQRHGIRFAMPGDWSALDTPHPSLAGDSHEHRPGTAL